MADGVLPPALVAGNPEFLRPLVGVKPQGGHFLHLYAADLGRGPDGQWWVLGDRTQAPSGAGYTIENRVAMSRALPELYQALNATRIAGFFQDFRDALTAMTGAGAARVGVLTPGPLNETYFEHAYLARYLGFLLLEGGDIVARNGRLMVKTVAGLTPIDVLWRRLDADFMDPLELNSASLLGVPGLVDVVRNGSATMVNALGSGLLETRALMAFWPAMCRHVRKEKLILPNIATWWCGGQKAKAHVLDHLDAMLVAPAMKMPHASGQRDELIFVPGLGAEERDAIAASIAARGQDYLAQEVVRLSTLPVWNGHGLEPRPFVLRVFLARGPQGWQVMPGGFCRVSERQDTRAFTMQKGGQAADLCIRSARPPTPVTLLPRHGGRFMRSVPGTLPSRAAESLFWLGRYSERAELITRVLRAATTLSGETGGDDNPVRAELALCLEDYGIEDMAGLPQELLDVVERALRAASAIRDRFAPDAWLILRDLVEDLRPLMSAQLTGTAAIEPLTRSLRALSALSGLAQENMYQTTGWRFLKSGRRLERAIGMTRLAARLGDSGAPVGSLDTLLEIADSVITHRRRYAVALAQDSVFDLVVLDPHNPRSVAYQVERLKEHVQTMPDRPQEAFSSPLKRQLVRLAVELSTTDAANVEPDFLPGIARRLLQISGALSARYFTGIGEAMHPLDSLA